MDAPLCILSMRASPLCSDNTIRFELLTFYSDEPISEHDLSRYTNSSMFVFCWHGKIFDGFIVNFVPFFTLFLLVVVDDVDA